MSQTKPEVVVFDLGKVLVDFDYGIAAAKIAAKGKSTCDEVNHFIAQSPLLFRYETGLITKQDFYAEVCKTTGYCGDLEEFGSHFSDIFTPIEPMVSLQAELRRRGTPTYIFSNTNDLAIGHIRKNFHRRIYLLLRAWGHETGRKNLSGRRGHVRQAVLGNSLSR